MKDEPSGTALRVALSRAAHQIFDRPLVLEDPVALAIVGERGVAQIRARSRLPASVSSGAWWCAR